jgi:NADH dehydrogenase
MMMPGVAQPAIQEGKYVADVIQRRVAAHGKPEPFWYWDTVDLAIVGRTYAVADLRFAKFAGFPAWVIWAIVHIYFLIGFANRLFVLLQWGTGFPDETSPSASVARRAVLDAEIHRSRSLMLE